MESRVQKVEESVGENTARLEDLTDRVGWLEAKAEMADDELIASRLARLEKAALDLTVAARLLRGLPLLLVPLLL